LMSRQRRLSSSSSSSLPRFLDGSFDDDMHALEEEDSLLGDRRRWCWGFLGAAVDEVLGRLGFILTRWGTVRRPVTRLGTRVR
jgi:hypothetical protein